MGRAGGLVPALRRRREEDDGAVVAPSGGRPQVSQKPSSIVPRHEGHLQFVPLIEPSFPSSICSPMPGQTRKRIDDLIRTAVLRDRRSPVARRNAAAERYFSSPRRPDRVPWIQRYSA
jgi:hypothetical protein